MIPILYANDETLFLSNGIGRLPDCISCTVEEERNGTYELEFVYPIDGKHYEDIKEGCLIYCTHDDGGDCQPFEIYKRSATIDGQVTFNAHHISYRLSNIIVKPFSITSASVGLALAGLEENAIGECPFTLQTTKSTTGIDFSVPEPDSIRARLGGVEGSILDTFGGGEYKFDKFTVTLYDARGVDNGVSIRYGKNLTDITAERSIEGRYTGVVPFWKDDAGIIVTLPEWYILSDEIPSFSVFWTNQNDVNITDQNGNMFEFDYLDISLSPMDLSDQWEEPPTVAQLRAKAKSKLESSKAWETEENIEIDFAALWQTPEYEDIAALQRVQLCDTVSIYYPALEVELKKKVIKTTYNVLLDRFDSIELGMPQSSLADVINERTVDMMSGYVKSSAMQAAIENATALIQGGLGGYVVMNTNANGEPQEILIMDTPDMATAVNVVRLNKNGIGFSTSGYGGTYRTAWTIDGHFVADFIDTGTLNASLLAAGSITSGLIAANAITTEKIYSGAVTTAKIDTGAITADRLRANAVTADKINSGAITTDKLDAGAVTAAKISVSQLSAIAANLGTITAGILRASAGGSSWNLNTGYFITDSGERSIQLYNGIIKFYKGTTQTGTIQPYYWSNDNQKEGVTFLAADNAKYLGIGRGGVSDIVINNGLDPDGVEEPIIFRTAVAVQNNVLPSTDYPSGQRLLGNSSRRFYQVWSSSFNFDSGVYMNYSSSNDWIFASKTVHSSSDETKKNISAYDGRYDDLVDALDPIVYTWKDHPNGASHVGLGARKTKSQIDECGIDNSGFVGIETDDEGKEVYSIDYNELTVMLLHKVQTQQARINELENTLSDVLKRLERLEAANADT